MTPEITTAAWWLQAASLSAQIYLAASRELRLPRVHDHTPFELAMYYLARPSLVLLIVAWLCATVYAFFLDAAFSLKSIIWLFSAAMFVLCFTGLYIKPTYVSDDKCQCKKVYKHSNRLWSKLAVLGVIPVSIVTSIEAVGERVPKQLQEVSPLMAHAALWTIHLIAEHLEKRAKSDAERKFLDLIGDITGDPEPECEPTSAIAAIPEVAEDVFDAMARSPDDPASPAELAGADENTPLIL